MSDRPIPPPGSINGPKAFVPAPELDEWARATFIDPGSPLHNEEHAHLGDASILWLWARDENKRSGRKILGQARIPMPPSSGGAWGRSAYWQQIEEWYGQQIIATNADLTPLMPFPPAHEIGERPDFVITIYAPHAAECSGVELCALVEHEMLHCAQAEDEFGAPEFNGETGLPRWAIRGHDIEEFASIAERYGPATPDLERLRVALSQPPTIGRASIASACGTCRAA